jgi:hypothetical protein
VSADAKRAARRPIGILLTRPPPSMMEALWKPQRRRDLKAEHILVVAPYNLAVRCIRERVPNGVEVGTVDRFQGRQAPVVFYAMTCSSSEEAPRGIDFLLDDHRLNVAVSRAQCLAVLVHSPRLLDANCRTLHAMELLDGVCSFVECAG